MSRLTIVQRLQGIWGNTRSRRLAYLVVALVLAVLCVVPRPYVARVKVLPQETSSSISSVLNSSSGVQGLAALLGAVKAPTDLYLTMGRSDDVEKAVIKRLALAGPGRSWPTMEKAQVAISRKVDVHSLLGGVIEIEVQTFDPQLSLNLATAYSDAIDHKINQLARDQIVGRQKVAQEKLQQARTRVAAAEAALRTFQQRNHVLLSPEAQFGSALTLQAGLEGQLQARLVELRTLQQFAGPESPELQALQANIASLRTQLAKASRSSDGPIGPSASGLTELSAQYLNLYRDYRFSQALYDVYSRFGEQAALEDVVATIQSNIQLVEAPHLDAWRHYNLAPMGLLVLLALIAFVTEFYAPATGIAIPGLRSPEPNAQAGPR